MSTSDRNVTDLLVAWTGGDREAAERVLPLLYGELRRIAAVRLRRERNALTLEPTVLVHEAYLRLAGLERIQWRDRAHFLAVASLAMRRFLVERARRAASRKRGNGRLRVPLDQVDASGCEHGVDLLVLDETLSRLAAFDPVAARAIELHCFGGLSVDETGQVLGFSNATATRRLRLAKAWLYRELHSDQAGGDRSGGR
jgi:RNA polymerase sigma-70 factor (ECF subfamily)